jgi:hypothetical protein
MTPLKLFLYKVRLHVLFKGVIDKLFKLLCFFRFAQWVDENRALAINDFPAAGNVYRRRYQVHEFVLQHEVKEQPINYLEFGVADCETFYWWLKQHTNIESRFFGFDTFTGLPEDWGNYKKGTFSLEGNMPPIDDPRGKLFKGLFQDTLDEFLKEFSNERKNIVLLDADLYSSTLFVLTTFAPFLKNDDIIMFDEFSEPQHEFLALRNFTEAFTHIKLTPFAASNNYACVAFKVSVARTG